MKRTMWSAVCVVLLVTGCGIQPSGVIDMQESPTGLAEGWTLYFVGEDGKLQPFKQRRGSLGTIAEALTSLIQGPPPSGFTTEIPEASAYVFVYESDNTITLRVPLADYEATETGIDQIVCTTLASHIQAGGSEKATVTVRFTMGTPGSVRGRTCPLLN
ncbi:GerMN domain-containing protein [Lysinibacter sp. HNR]|uniref:GerMN domain-containing protein n=1 Tax=Lysinibacter sp. HNR TaxID=3031408 RepID=UPI0024356887|nr:GerMN domain-containing protein [Lysinibacter sp. HNR]WGD37643.1 GerMN domain-containing protein [Lysinibacter sp. HNR]